MKNILIYGAGYVGLANGLLLARANKVTIIDINKEIVKMLSKGEVHIDDDGCKKEIKNTSAMFTTGENIDYKKYDLAILALPTNYDTKTKKFDTSFLDEVLKKISKHSLDIIIKSTVPIGYTESKSKELNKEIIFSPEFLREGSSFSDALNPSRIIIGAHISNDYGELFKNVSKNSPEILNTNPTEAESIKLFANTYLAMRVSFVNELATFSKLNNLDKKSIIKGIGLDPRIGSGYFSPSVGYGGYCLPKDSKQLKHEFNSKHIPSRLFDAIVDSNKVRMEFIVNQVLKSDIGEIEIDGIGHKPGVKNYRNSPKLIIAKMLRDKGIKVTIVDPNFAGTNIDGFEIKKVGSKLAKKISYYV